MTLSDKLDDYEKGVSAWLDQAKKATAAIQRLERAVATGNLRDLDRLRLAAQTATESAAQRGAECPPFEFDAAAYLDDGGGFTDEVIRAAEKLGVRLSEREGTIFSYPVLVTREAANTAIRIDKKLVATLRPETLAALLKQAQSKEPKARPQPFLEALFDAYELLRARRRIDDYIDQPLFRIYQILSLHPGMGYTLPDFTRDLYLLDTSGVIKTRRGFVMSLPNSTGSREKSARILPFVTRDGFTKDYASIRFTPPGKGE